jgi:hypothetical protein
MTLSIEYNYADCRNCINVTLSVVMLNVVMLSVVAPKLKLQCLYLPGPSSLV